MNRRTRFKAMGTLLSVAGACFFAALFYTTADTAAFIMQSEKTAGTIVNYTARNDVKNDGTPRTDHYPVIEYRDGRGRTFTFESDTAKNYEVWLFIKARESGFKSALYRAPELSVRYIPGDQPRARLADSFTDLWGTPLAAGFMSLVFSLVGGALLYFGYRKALTPGKTDRL